MIDGYLIFESNDRGDLIRQINKAIREKSWTPLGGVCVTINSAQGNTMFYQAMVRNI
jgi:hypothetical protein